MDKIKASQFADLAYYSRFKPWSLYQQVEYLQGTGTQYINIGIVPTPTDILSAEYQIINTNLADNTLFYIDSGSAKSNAYGFSMNQDGGVRRYVCGWSGYATAGGLDTNKHILQMGNAQFYVDSSVLTTFTGANPNITHSIYLFGWRRSGNFLLGGQIKVFRFKITSASQKVLIDLVPCVRKSDNKPGMYDTVTETFFINSGTGEFTVGGNV